MKTAAIVLLLASSTAFAETTVELAPTCVVLADGDPMPAQGRLLLVRALEQADQLIVESGCTETITLSHEKTGTFVHVRITNGRAERTATVTLHDDMLATYKTLVAALLAPPPSISSVPDLEDDPPSEQDIAPVDPVRVRQIYMRLGIASLAGHEGGGYVFGVRRGSRFVWDVSLAVIGADEGRGGSTVSARAQGLQYASPRSGSSLYGGGGFSLGATELEQMDYTSETGGGLQIEGTVGVEWNRRGRFPVSVEANVGLPLYEIGDTYPATFVASFGVAM